MPYDISLQMEFGESGESTAPAALGESADSDSLLYAHCLTPQPYTHAHGNLHLFHTVTTEFNIAPLLNLPCFALKLLITFATD